MMKQGKKRNLNLSSPNLTQTLRCATRTKLVRDCPIWRRYEMRVKQPTPPPLTHASDIRTPSDTVAL